MNRTTTVSQVTSRIRTVSLLAASLLALTACGTGTESIDSTGTAGNTSDSDSRNTALAGDDGKPFAGISNTFRYVAVNPADRGVWLGAHRTHRSRARAPSQVERQCSGRPR
ncbi:MAG: hypothetical protein RJB57_98 [Actinomycetota bacterium]